MSEFSILDTLPRVSLCEDEHVNECTRYLNNLAFNDSLDIIKNIKFPGALVVSLSRRDLPRLKGQPTAHLPYKPTDILCWMQPVDRNIPPVLKLQIQQARPKKRLELFSEKALNLATVDFGFDDGLFSFLGPLPLAVTDFDFGDATGTFMIREIY